VVSYTAVSPLPRVRGGLLSVALARGSPRAGVTGHPALWSPDFPQRLGRCGRPAGSERTTGFEPAASTLATSRATCCAASACCTVVPLLADRDAACMAPEVARLTAAGRRGPRYNDPPYPEPPPGAEPGSSVVPGRRSFQLSYGGMITLGAQDSNLNWRGQGPPGCQLPHRPWSRSPVLPRATRCTGAGSQLCAAAWCARRESNPHALDGHCLLKTARLPFPPPAHGAPAPVRTGDLLITGETLFRLSYRGLSWDTRTRT